jgi:sulfonate transport system substrate-binding protein
MGLLIAAKVLGLQEGRDFIVKNIGAADIMTMPKGIDVTGMWEPNTLMMTEFVKNARILELMDRYTVFTGYSWMRGEIEQHAPDVIQAYTDAFVEARLLAQLKPKEVIDALAADPSQRGRDRRLIERDAEIHVFNPKPTVSYPFENARGFMINLEVYQAGVMTDANVLKRRFTVDDFKGVWRPMYLTNTFAKLGWKVPKTPAFIPAGWTGEAGKPPYPPYGAMYMGKQVFPGPGDLAKEWSFGGKLHRP